MIRSETSKKRQAVTGVAERRAEILGMITRLEANRRSKRNSSPRPHRDPEAPSSRSNSRAPASSRRPPSSTRLSAPATSLAGLNDVLAGLVDLVRNMEARLARMEDRMSVLSIRRSSRAPAPAVPNDATFCGLIKGQLLSDMLQLVTSNHMSGLFVIESELSKCRLYFDEGRICHAENGNMTGEDAFFAAFGAQSGRYHFTETDDLPEEKTVSVGTQYLVLEALRRMDETHAG